jgi:2-desacetyl-2-hydroxyethyl bacteriochlorophyllide A dehydrogenase
MVLGAPGELTSADVDRPSPDGGGTVVRVTNSGICGTDLKIYGGGIPVHYPLIMGHEMIGEVVERADGDGPEVGRRVIVDPVLFCGACFHCGIGQTNLCASGGLLGRDRDGGFAEYVAAPPGNIFAMPDEIGNREAPLIQVLTTCLHAQRLASISSGNAVVVLGLGVSGLLHVQLAKAQGADPVIGVTRSAWKRELAEELGADMTLAPDEKTKGSVVEATGGVGADLVIESVGRLSVLAQAIDVARFGGRVLSFGIHTVREGSLPFYDMYFKELTFINARAAKGRDFPASIDLVRRGAVRLAPLVSHSLPLDQLDKALGLLEKEIPQRAKVVLEHA